MKTKVLIVSIKVVEGCEFSCDLQTRIQESVNNREIISLSPVTEIKNYACVTVIVKDK